jgi:hypothetical protein
MADTAADLMDQVLQGAPNRQWVLSEPYCLIPPNPRLMRDEQDCQGFFSPTTLTQYGLNLTVLP